MRTFETWKESAAQTWPGLDEKSLRSIYDSLTREETLSDLVEALNEYDDGEGWARSHDLDEVLRSLDGEEEVGVMFTTHGANEEHELQVSYDLSRLRLVGYLDGTEVQAQEFNSLEEIIEDIQSSSWDDYYSWMTDADEVQTVIALEDAACSVCYLFNPYYYDRAEELRKAYREKSGDLEEFNQSRAGFWCMDNGDDLDDDRLRDALRYYDEVHAEYLSMLEKLEEA